MSKLLNTAVIIGLSGLLIGCPGGKTGAKTKTGSKTGAAKTEKTGDAPDGDGDAPAASAKADISHVKKGSTYHYDMDASGTKMTMKYVVTDITDKVIKYDSITVVMGNENKTAMEWPIPGTVEAPAATGTPAAAPEMKDETVEAAGEKWECKMSENAGTKTWVPFKNGLPTFPPLIKMDGATKMTLTKVE